jgi:hypothetical protein
MQFNLKLQNDFKNNIRREWALTNGLGGYAGGSVTGAINRTHQGYLIASLHAPVQRYVCFSKTNEKITLKIFFFQIFRHVLNRHYNFVALVFF